ncbi:MAG: tetratricopeptide repeat protein, partial [Desulfobacterales bacterium]|nr:tetratricopeptide repeat protein [Desulfobacterales bacterium]
RDIIRNYPGPNKENAQAVYRLAESYSRLNFYYEALLEFKNLCSKYPESDYIPESLYMTGEMYYKTKKFSEAIEKFKEYITRFPDGKHARDAYFGTGNCYSQTRQFNDADIWYGNALKKWPALENIPEDTLLNLGAHYFQTGKYDNALGFFFVCLNMFPDSKHCKGTLYKIARSFEAMGQLRSALKVLSLVVERYPGSGEAQESALIMANIGIKDPGIKLPVYILPGMDYYRAPIETYEKMAGKLSDLDMEEELIFRKGEGLIKRE